MVFIVQPQFGRAVQRLHEHRRARTLTTEYEPRLRGRSRGRQPLARSLQTSLRVAAGKPGGALQLSPHR